MPLPEAQDVYLVRSVWGGSTVQRNASFALHFEDSVGTSNAAALGTLLVATFTANMWKLIAPTCNMQQLLITPLDAISSTYSQPITVGNANISGAGTGDPILQGAAVVSIRSAQRGKQWRNRAYLPFIGESEQAGGTLTTGDVTTAQTAWNTFFTAMAAGDWPATVVAPSEPGPLSNFLPAAGYTVRPYLKTQRRRARR